MPPGEKHLVSRNLDCFCTGLAKEGASLVILKPLTPLRKEEKDLVWNLWEKRGKMDL